MIGAVVFDLDGARTARCSGSLPSPDRHFEATPFRALVLGDLSRCTPADSVCCLHTDLALPLGDRVTSSGPCRLLGANG